MIFRNDCESDLNQPIDKPRSLTGSDWGSVQPVHFQPSLSWSRLIKPGLLVKIEKVNMNNWTSSWPRWLARNFNTTYSQHLSIVFILLVHTWSCPGTRSASWSCSDTFILLPTKTQLSWFFQVNSVLQWNLSSGTLSSFLLLLLSLFPLELSSSMIFLQYEFLPRVNSWKIMTVSSAAHIFCLWSIWFCPSKICFYHNLPFALNYYLIICHNFPKCHNY